MSGKAEEEKKQATETEIANNLYMNRQEKKQNLRGNLGIVNLRFLKHFQVL